MGDIVFVDTETLGLDIASPIWEFAAIRRFEDDINGETTESEMHLFIHHDPGVWLDTLREDFLADYSARFDETGAFCKASAARTIASFLSGQPTLVGAVPDFDTNRIRHQLLAPLGIEEPWHYHLVDVENLIVGYLAGRGTLLPPPWHSNTLSMAVGVDPGKYRRHTAMGDVQLVRDQYDAVMSGVVR